jgi:hypothetical protein
MRSRFRAIGRGLLLLSALSALAVLLTDSARAGFDLGVGGEQTSSAPTQLSTARVEQPIRSSSRERSLGAVRKKDESPPPSAKSPCEQNVQLAASKGLRLPDGWDLNCVGPGLDWEGGTHWGVTCRYAECPEGQGPYVSISNPTYYVVAHELCHANFGDDERMADACAAEHGASLATSPYS